MGGDDEDYDKYAKWEKERWRLATTPADSHSNFFFYTNIQYMRYITKANIQDQQCCVAYTAIFPIGRQIYPPKESIHLLITVPQKRTEV